MVIRWIGVEMLTDKCHDAAVWRLVSSILVHPLDARSRVARNLTALLSAHAPGRFLCRSPWPSRATISFFPQLLMAALALIAGVLIIVGM